MTAVTIQEAQANLPELIHKLGPGEELVILENNRTVAKLTAVESARPVRPGPGLCKDMISIVADDEAHLADFESYMP